MHLNNIGKVSCPKTEQQSEMVGVRAEFNFILFNLYIFSALLNAILTMSGTLYVICSPSTISG